MKVEEVSYGVAPISLGDSIPGVPLNDFAALLAIPDLAAATNITSRRWFRR